MCRDGDPGPGLGSWCLGGPTHLSRFCPGSRSTRKCAPSRLQTANAARGVTVVAGSGPGSQIGTRTFDGVRCADPQHTPARRLANRGHGAPAARRQSGPVRRNATTLAANPARYATMAPGQHSTTRSAHHATDTPALAAGGEIRQAPPRHGLPRPSDFRHREWRPTKTPGPSVVGLDAVRHPL